MAKRKYTKKSDYWDKFDKERPAPVPQNSDCEPDLLGEPFYVSSASQTEVSNAAYNRTPTRGKVSRVNRAAVSETIDKYSSIRKGMLPYQFSLDGVTIRLAIELCQKAYANVAVFRNAVDIMAEFANTEIFLEGGTQKSRNFFENWFSRINLNNLKDQYFREYYRSGNIFLYRVDGKFKVDDFSRLAKTIPTGSTMENTVPVRYILLNPFDIVAKRASTFSTGAYEKVLSEYELARLQNPTTEEDQQIYESLPAEMRKGIKDGSYFANGLQIELDPKKLSYSFYKKQDYEPFAIPFRFQENGSSYYENRRKRHSLNNYGDGT